MLIKFLNPGLVVAAVLYVQSQLDALGRKRTAAPEHFFGSEEFLRLTIENSSLRHPLASSVLCYSEPQHVLGSDRQRRHLERFADIKRGGLPWTRVMSYGIGHSGQRGCDSHLLEAKVDLLTHKQLPFWSGTPNELEIFNTWRRLTNLEDGLSDADDEWRQRFLSRVPPALPRKFHPEFRQLDYELTLIAEDGWITNRDDLVETLAVRGYKVAAVADFGLEVINKTGVRFSYVGGKFAKDFDFAYLVEVRNMARVRDPKAVADEIKVLKPQLALLEGARQREFARLFGSGCFSESHSVHPKLVKTYASRTLKAAGAMSPASVLNEADVQSSTLSTPPIYGNQHKKSESSGLARIREQRALFAETTLAAVAQHLGGNQKDLHAAVESADRTRTVSGAATGIASALLRDANALSRAIEEHGEQGGSGCHRPDLQRALGVGGGNCERARVAVRPFLVPPDPFALLRDPRTGMLPLPFSPSVKAKPAHSHEL